MAENSTHDSQIFDKMKLKKPGDDLDPCFDLVTDHCRSLSEDVEEDNFNSVHGHAVFFFIGIIVCIFYPKYLQ